MEQSFKEKLSKKIFGDDTPLTTREFNKSILSLVVWFAIGCLIGIQISSYY